MAQEIKKCTVRIGGVFYQLVTRENEQYTRQIAAHADEMIYRIMEENEHLNQTMATVLSLVNVLDDLVQSKKQQGLLEKELAEAKNKAGQLALELDKARDQHWELKKEMLDLTEKNQAYQAQVEHLSLADEAEAELFAPDVATDDLPDLVELALADEAVQEDKDQLKQTNLDDYLAAFGQMDPPGEAKQDDGEI